MTKSRIANAGSVLFLFSKLIGLTVFPPVKPKVKVPSVAANRQITRPDTSFSWTARVRSKKAPMFRMFLTLRRTVPFRCGVASQSKSSRDKEPSTALKKNSFGERLVPTPVKCRKLSAWNRSRIRFENGKHPISQQNQNPKGFGKTSRQLG